MKYSDIVTIFFRKQTHIMGKIKSFNEICKICHKLQKEGKKVVFCHGFFDILHRGHVTLLVEAKKLGDVLVVGVDHDYNAKILKGPNRPINDHDSRMFVLANLEPVDFVFLVGSIEKANAGGVLSEFYTNIYKKLKPDVLATSVKAGRFAELRRKQAEEIGMKFVDVSGYIHKTNTSKTLRLLGLE